MTSLRYFQISSVWSKRKRAQPPRYVVENHLSFLCVLSSPLAQLWSRAVSARFNMPQKLSKMTWSIPRNHRISTASCLHVTVTARLIWSSSSSSLPVVLTSLTNLFFLLADLDHTFSFVSMRPALIDDFQCHLTPSSDFSVAFTLSAAHAALIRGTGIVCAVG